MGQGMCQGLRDAGNLAWKLAAVVRGEAGEALLDSYTAERRPHVEATTLMAKQLGVMLSERDPARARERDARLLREGGGQAPTLVRQELIPPLAHGLFALHTPRAGEVLPQPRVRCGGRELLLDDLLGAAWRLVVATDERSALTAYVAAAAQHRVPLVIVGSASAPAGALAVVEANGLLRDWLAAAGVCGALVRPDHHVYGGFATPAEALALLQQRAAALSPAARPSHDTPHHEGDIRHATTTRA
jgi:3-(3-hydroxy-phenyl)propionate hydroxylase